MKLTLKAVGLISAVVLVSACETTPADNYMLGAATQQNAQLQSVRDVNLPNSKAVESTSGVRAARAVQALNNGEMKDVSEAGASATSGGG